MVIDTTLALDSSLRFRNNHLERIEKLIMTIDDKIIDKKMQCDMNREAAKISALSSGETEKYEYLAREEILPSDQGRIKERTTFAHSPLGKAFEKQIKAIEDQREKQINTLGKDEKQLVKSSSQK